MINYDMGGGVDNLNFKPIQWSDNGYSVVWRLTSLSSSCSIKDGSWKKVERDPLLESYTLL